MYDFENNTSPSVERLLNLHRLVCVLHDLVEKNHSPDYVLEKWNRYMGEEVKLVDAAKDSSYVVRFYVYKKVWGEVALEIRSIYYFISLLENNYRVKNIFKWFEYFGGDFDKIPSERQKGLHELLQQKSYEMLNKDKTCQALLRELKIKEVLE